MCGPKIYYFLFFLGCLGLVAGAPTDAEVRTAVARIREIVDAQVHIQADAAISLLSITGGVPNSQLELATTSGNEVAFAGALQAASGLDLTVLDSLLARSASEAGTGATRLFSVGAGCRPIFRACCPCVLSSSFPDLSHVPSVHAQPASSNLHATLLQQVATMQQSLDAVVQRYEPFIGNVRILDCKEC
jgi:hypothetical protein